MTRSLVKQLKPKFEAIKDVNEAFIRVRHEIPVSPAREGTESIPGVRQVICVASEKVGLASPPQLSILLWPSKRRGRSELLDADIYGPSQALMLGFKANALKRLMGNHLTQ